MPTLLKLLRHCSEVMPIIPVIGAGYERINHVRIITIRVEIVRPKIPPLRINYRISVKIFKIAILNERSVINSRIETRTSRHELAGKEKMPGRLNSLCA
jgi:hypothetical protein